MTTLLDVMIAERNARDDELKFLKDCQRQYFQLAVLSTAAVATMFPFLDRYRDALPFNAPLFVVLPCWWIFFDKAKTISRIVAYKRVLESMIIAACSSESKTDDHGYIGWETALGKFRESEKKVKLGLWKAGKLQFWKKATLREKAYGIAKLLIMQNAHKYWGINFYTFSMLSGAMIYFSYLNATDKFYIQTFSFAISLLAALTFSSTFVTVYDLIDGWDSYNTNEAVWRQILQSPRS